MPHVRKKRKYNKDWSWFRAFYAVIRLGGDDDKEDDQRRVANRISSRAKKRKSQAQMSRKSAMSHWTTRHYDKKGGDKNEEDSESSKMNSVLPPPPLSLNSSRQEEHDSSMSCDLNVDEFEIDSYGNEGRGDDLETIQEVLHVSHISSKVQGDTSFGNNLPLSASASEANGGLERLSQDDFEEHALKDSHPSTTNMSSSITSSFTNIQVKIGKGPKTTNSFDSEKEATGLLARKYYKSTLIESSKRPCTNEVDDVEKAIFDVKDAIAGDDISNRIFTSI